MASTLDDELQNAAGVYQALQSEISAAVDARQKLDAQLAENEQVKKEFETLKAHNTVYKMIGPVLVQQEHAEARQTVDKRLEFIRNEINRVEAQIKDLAAKADAKKMEISTLQGKRQQAAGPQGQQPAAAPAAIAV